MACSNKPDFVFKIIAAGTFSVMRNACGVFVSNRETGGKDAIFPVYSQKKRKISLALTEIVLIL